MDVSIQEVIILFVILSIKILHILFSIHNAFLIISKYRKLGIIKRRIRNKARVEGSIVNEHLVNEIATYCSLYFAPTVETRHNQEP